MIGASPRGGDHKKAGTIWPRLLSVQNLNVSLIPSHC